MKRIISSKTISVSQLPASCYCKKELVSMVVNPRNAMVNVVLTDEGALVGYPDPDALRRECKSNAMIQYHVSHIRLPEQVAVLGNLVDHRTAVALFPDHSQMFQ